jgi:hypothetical protein
MAQHAHADCCANATAQPVGSTAFNAADRLAVINLVNSYGYLADNFGATRFDELFDELFAADATVELHAGDKMLVDGLTQFKDFVGKRHAKLMSWIARTDGQIQQPRMT